MRTTGTETCSRPSGGAARPCRGRASRLLIALAAAVPVTSAMAVNLPPGGAVPLFGSVTSGGVIIRDEVIPFEIIDGGGFTLFAGRVQDRVVRRADGKLIFLNRIRDTLVDTEGAVVEALVDGYEGLATDVDWDPSSPGSRTPFQATRTGDGKVIGYDFSQSPIHESEESKFFYAETDAEFYSVNGTLTIRLQSGESTTIEVARPFEDDTPPIAEIQSPTPLSCTCNPVTIKGIAYDPDGTYASDVAEYRPISGGPWFLIGQSFVETPPPGGVLYVWNTGGLAQGYYFLRLSVFNTAGLDSEDTTIVWVDQQFDNLTVAGPSDGQVLGGVICPNGVLDDHCPEQYSVEYAPQGTINFQPVQPGTPVYFGQKINQTFAPWDTIAGAIPDGDYTIRVTASDDCGHTAVETRDVTVDNTPPTVEIVSPLPCVSVDGLVEIVGTVFDLNLDTWTLQYTGGSQNGWATIATGTTNIVNDLLAVWDTSNLEPCCYTLRLLGDDEAIINCNSAINQTSQYLVSIDVGTDCPGDLDGDQLIGFGDLLFVLSNWGPCP